VGRPQYYAAQIQKNAINFSDTGDIENTIKSADMFYDYMVYCKENDQQDLMSPLIEKILNGEIMPDEWTPTLLAQLGRNAGAKKMGIHARQRQWTDDEKEFYCTLKMCESGQGALNFMGLHQPIPSSNTLEAHMKKKDSSGCGEEGFRTNAVEAMIASITALQEEEEQEEAKVVEKELVEKELVETKKRSDSGEEMEGLACAEACAVKRAKVAPFSKPPMSMDMVPHSVIEPDLIIELSDAEMELAEGDIYAQPALLNDPDGWEQVTTWVTTDADLQSLMPGNIYAADSSAMLTQYKDAFLVPLWQVVKKDPQCKFLSLKFDETDLKEEQGEIETFNRSTQVHEVKFWGDEYIPGIKMDKETLTVQYEAMLQIPGYLMTGNGTKPNDVELLASLHTLYKFLMVKEPIVRAPVEAFGASLLTERAKLEKQCTNHVKLGAIHRSILCLTTARFDAEAQLRVVTNAVSLLAGVLAIAPTTEAWRQRVQRVIGEAWMGVQATFRCLRTAARKMLCFRAQDPIHGHDSEVAGLFLIRGILKPEMQSLIAEFQTTTTYLTTSSDGGFSFLREQNEDVDGKHRPETMRMVAKQAEFDAKAPFVAAIQQKRKSNRDLGRTRKDGHTPLDPTLSVDERQAVKVKVVDTFFATVLPQGLERNTPQCEIVERVEAKLRYNRAGVGQRENAYPATLRCGDAEVVPPTSEELHGITMPQLTCADLDDLFVRIEGEQVLSPIMQHGLDDPDQQHDGLDLQRQWLFLSF